MVCNREKCRKLQIDYSRGLRTEPSRFRRKTEATCKSTESTLTHPRSQSLAVLASPSYQAWMPCGQSYSHWPSCAWTDGCEVRVSKSSFHGDRPRRREASASVYPCRLCDFARCALAASRAQPFRGQTVLNPPASAKCTQARAWRDKGFGAVVENRQSSGQCDKVAPCEHSEQFREAGSLASLSLAVQASSEPF